MYNYSQRSRGFYAELIFSLLLLLASAVLCLIFQHKIFHGAQPAPKAVAQASRSAQPLTVATTVKLFHPL